MVAGQGVSPRGEGRCWAQTMGCSYLNATRWQACPFLTDGNSGCWELRLADEFVYSSIIYSFMVFIPQALWTPYMRQQALCWV